MKAAVFILGIALGFTAGVEFARYVAALDRVGCIDD